MAAWRRRRALRVADVADRAGLSSDWLTALESGTDWLDRRGSLSSMASVLRVDPADLTGQPYPPYGEDHIAVRAVAFHLRRALAAASAPGPRSGSSALKALEARMEQVAAAEAAGDEAGLAALLSDLITLSDAVAACAPARGRGRADDLRARAHVAAAGLLRRLGYRDLAWILLHRAHPGTDAPAAVLVEEIRLLIDLGLPEYALARAERAQASGVGAELPPLVAFAHAMADRPLEAEQVLADAEDRADDAGEHATFSAARVLVSLEAGDAGRAVEHAARVHARYLAPAARVALLVASAGASARVGDIGTAARDLSKAEQEAPLRLRLDPFVRELLTVLPQRADDSETSEGLRQMAVRAGLG